MTDNLNIEPDLFYDKTELSTAEDKPEMEPEEVEETSDEEPEEADSEESEESDADEEEQQEDEALYIDLDGEEVSLDDVKTWRQAAKDIKSMQADYTRKTQDISNRASEKAREMVGEKLDSLTSLTAELQALIDSEEKVDLEELREYDEGEYYKQLHKKEQREKLIAKAKESLTAKAEVNQDEVAVERQKLAELNPEWVKDGKATDAYSSDMKLLEEYLNNESNGWTQEEFSKVYKASQFMAILKAAKYDALQGKKKAIVEKKKLIPVAKKGAQKVAPKKPNKSLEDFFYK